MPASKSNAAIAKMDSNPGCFFVGVIVGRSNEIFKHLYTVFTIKVLWKLK
jgi:hypothetical protein